MIDYNNITPEELAKYYTGLGYIITENAGGILVSTGPELQGVFYKIDEDHFAAVSSKTDLGFKIRGARFQIQRENQPIDFQSSGLLLEEDIRPVKSVQELQSLVGFWDRRKFEPSIYTPKSR